MMTEEDRTIRPGEGLGRLRFGMSPAQVDALSDAYGSAKGRRNGRIPDPVLRETLERFGEGMSEEEKQDLIAVYAESGPSADSVTETRGDPGLVLGYRGDRLVEIMSAERHRPLFLDGTDVLSLGTPDALALLERLNGGPGRYDGTRRRSMSSRSRWTDSASRTGSAACIRWTEPTSAFGDARWPCGRSHPLRTMDHFAVRELAGWPGGLANGRPRRSNR